MFALFVGLTLAVAAIGSNSGACTLCHERQAAAEASSMHAGTPCYSCHLSEGAWGFLDRKGRELTQMYPAALLGGKPSGPVIQTRRDACLVCHQDTAAETLTTGRTLKVNHVACASSGSCDPCHSAVAHGDLVRWQSGIAMDECLACHQQRKVPTECRTCHVGQVSLDRDREGSWRVTHGENRNSTHGMGEPDSCAACHEGRFCADCHGTEIPHTAEFGQEHGRIALADRAACSTCHRSEVLCDGCHGIEMPHPPGFTAAHVRAAAGKSDGSCLRCHAEGDCDKCHQLHMHPGGSQGVPVPWTITDERLRPEESQ